MKMHITNLTHQRVEFSYPVVRVPHRGKVTVPPLTQITLPHDLEEIDIQNIKSEQGPYGGLAEASEVRLDGWGVASHRLCYQIGEKVPQARLNEILSPVRQPEESKSRG
jgi:hypothetical protein